MHQLHPVFITGGTGYMGTRLIRRLLKDGHPVTALVRKGSENKLPAGATPIIGDYFDPATFYQYIPEGAVFVQLLGVAHPSPKKAQQFRDIDLTSVRASVIAAKEAAVSHFIYVSVAMAPSKIMAAYQGVRKEGEELCLSANLSCTFIRPWYVLGPGHYWPILLLPVYGIAELVPSWRKKARAMGLVRIGQLIRTLVSAVKQPPQPCSILEIKDIRKF
jgi:uncharacterized protein YbjT (DUF2867 family)